jgi:protein-disulfide isomerase
MTINRKFKFSHLALTAFTCLVFFAPQTARAEAFTAEQKEELKKLFDAYIMENPETIMKSVDQFRMKQEQQTAQDAEANLAKHKDFLLSKDRPSTGNPEADVTIVEYFDYNCGYCKRFFDDMVTLLKDDTNVRVVLIDLPILSPASDVMARFALAAHKQGKYFEMHQALMKHRGGQTEEEFLAVAKTAGLDVEKLKADKNDPSIEQELVKHRETAKDIGIQGTPGLVIGDQIYRGYIGLDGIKQSIKDVREKKPAQ